MKNYCSECENKHMCIDDIKPSFWVFIKNKIKKIFKGKSADLQVIKEDLGQLLPTKTSYNIEIPWDRLIKNFDYNKKTIVLIDDSKMILTLLQDYLTTIGLHLEDYNILDFYSIYAPFVLRDTLKELAKNPSFKVDYAVVDIVLPGKIKDSQNYIKMDGIDVAKILHDMYKCRNFKFFSGNVLNHYIDYIQEKVVKFEEYFGKDLYTYIILKNEDDQIIQAKLKELFKNELPS